MLCIYAKANEFRRKGSIHVLIDHIEIKNVGCEYGEYVSDSIDT
jgi:hypothetical protein